jgi:hypothetical protein
VTSLDSPREARSGATHDGHQAVRHLVRQMQNQAFPRRERRARRKSLIFAMFFGDPDRC